MADNFLSKGEFLNTAAWQKHPDIEPPQTDIIRDFDGKFVGFGSCFAQNLRDTVTPLGFSYWYDRGICGHYSAGSVANVMEIIATGRELSEDDLHFVEGNRETVLAPSFFFKRWNFGETAAERTLAQMRRLVTEAEKQIKECSYIALTLGTARVARLAETGRILNTLTGIDVKHCTFEMSTAEENVAELERIYGYIAQIRDGDIPPIFLTISPQRYIFSMKIVAQDVDYRGPVRDQFVDNMLSKSILRVAVEEFAQRHPDVVHYFPSYEIVIDEMRSTESLSHYDFTHVEQTHTVQRIVKKFLLSNCSEPVIRQLNMYEALWRTVDYIMELAGGGMSLDHAEIVDRVDEQLTKFEALEEKLSPAILDQFERLIKLVGQKFEFTTDVDQKMRDLRGVVESTTEMDEMWKNRILRVIRLKDEKQLLADDSSDRMLQFAQAKNLDIFSGVESVGKYWGTR